MIVKARPNASGGLDAYATAGVDNLQALSPLSGTLTPAQVVAALNEQRQRLNELLAELQGTA